MKVERIITMAAGTAMLIMLAACGDDASSNPAGTRASPCSDGTIQDLGVPNPFDRYASFEVTQGPVWLSVKDWQANGALDPRGDEGALKLGPLDEPPEADVNGHIATQTHTLDVTGSRWSRLQLDPGEYWLLASGNADHVAIQTCGDAHVRGVAPAS